MRPAIQWESDYDPEYAADISYAPDGKTLATVTGTGRLYTGGKTLSVWDVATGRRLKKIASQGLTTVAFLPGGNAVVTGSDDGAIRVWDVAGSRLEKEWPAHAKAVRSIVIVPGHSQIASVSEDGAFKLWNPETGKLVRELGR
jgi:WD40 repeat protein